jgi:hypothetical protein
MRAERKDRTGPGLRQRKFDLIERRPPGLRGLAASDANDRINLLYVESALPE